jgi:hypothetical protein
MKIKRKGNLKGLDIDYEVHVDDPEEVDELHNDLLEQGLLFTYATGGKPYKIPTENIVLHYIDKKLRLYDFAILFTPQPPRPKKVKKETPSKLDLFYKKAETNASFRKRLLKYMHLNKLVYALIQHIKAYHQVSSSIKELVHKTIPIKDYTIELLEEFDKAKMLELE